MNEQQIIESTYFDNCTIKRDRRIENEYGESTLQSNVTIYDNVKCAFSKSSMTNTVQTEEGNTISYNTVLFLNPSHILKEGDKAIVSSMGREYTLVIGQSKAYPSHQEAIAMMDGEV